MFDHKSRLILSYPLCNKVTLPPQFVTREIEVRRVRDLVAQPLELSEFLRRPFLRRSRWLITGVDLQCGSWRQFYAGASAEYSAPGTLRIGLYEPDASEPYKIMDYRFESNPEHLRTLYRLMRELQTRDFGDLRPCIIADDLRLVG